MILDWIFTILSSIPNILFFTMSVFADSAPISLSPQFGEEAKKRPDFAAIRKAIQSLHDGLDAFLVINRKGISDSLEIFQSEDEKLEMRRKYYRAINLGLRYGQETNDLYLSLPEESPYHTRFDAVTDASCAFVDARKEFKWAEKVLQHPVDEVTGETLHYAIGCLFGLRIRKDPESGETKLYLVDWHRSDEEQPIEVSDFTVDSESGLPTELTNPITGTKHAIKQYPEGYEFDRVGRNADDRWNPDCRLAQDFYWKAYFILQEAQAAYQEAVIQLYAIDQELAEGGNTLAISCIELKKEYYTALDELPYDHCREPLVYHYWFDDRQEPDEDGDLIDVSQQHVDIFTLID